MVPLDVFAHTDDLQGWGLGLGGGRNERAAELERSAITRPDEHT